MVADPAIQPLNQGKVSAAQFRVRALVVRKWAAEGAAKSADF